MLSIMKKNRKQLKEHGNELVKESMKKDNATERELEENFKWKKWMKSVKNNISYLNTP